MITFIAKHLQWLKSKPKPPTAAKSGASCDNININIGNSVENIVENENEGNDVNVVNTVNVGNIGNIWNMGSAKSNINFGNSNIVDCGESLEGHLSECQIDMEGSNDMNGNSLTNISNNIVTTKKRGKKRSKREIDSSGSEDDDIDI